MASTSPDEPTAIATTWLTDFTAAISSRDHNAVAATFLPFGWLRDVLTFVWDTRSLRGPEAIASYLAESDRLAAAQVSNILLSEDPSYRTKWAPGPAGPRSSVEAGFDYETVHARGRGYVRLAPGPDGAWKVLTLGMIIVDLKGHEEPERAKPEWDDESCGWEEREERCRADIEADPYVLIVGGGHIGLTIAARFHQMDIPALVIERNARIGESWRRRYKSLRLHTTRGHHQLLYQPFPTNWPIFSPASMIADWLESYATQQRIVHWLSTSIDGQPTYDFASKRWDVTVRRNGQLVRLRPAHIVIATGTHGAPYTPPLEDRDSFPGQVLHASAYVDARLFVGKSVAVIGAANTGSDVAEDLARGGATRVTLVQRGPACVVSRASIRTVLDATWPEDEPVGASDLKFAALPLGFIREMNINSQEQAWAAEKVLHDKLRRGGMELWLGPDGAGQFIMANMRGGGFWMDKGAGDLIGSGGIQIKRGEPNSFSKEGLVFKDGSKLEADVIIFATGYRKMRENLKGIFGSDTIEQAGECLGMDEEGELKGHYRPSGHPGFWWAPGEFSMVRPMSKQLAILIKAIQVGVLQL
ncbi:NAD(P)/FAD-dependent oxidoreductase [Phanerochaete sordida]|uniref:NAD(P)/FAD-dependent oxidoreductase n=1 Tax=Phanerochaete sordida TaxID=48140 RepID=A0A9P3GK61_9APHY|nr:NAD(P)/FAD-dependent oxidoreductase [Phanerochaete sordida]